MRPPWLEDARDSVESDLTDAEVCVEELEEGGDMAAVADGVVREVGEEVVEVVIALELTPDSERVVGAPRRK